MPNGRIVKPVAQKLLETIAVEAHGAVAALPLLGFFFQYDLDSVRLISASRKVSSTAFGERATVLVISTEELVKRQTMI